MFHYEWKSETRLELHPMGNEYPVLKTSASGHVECRTSRPGGGAGRHWTVHVCKGGLQCLIRLQSQKKKTSGHTDTIWSWRIIDFRPKLIDAQRYHKQGNICAGMWVKAALGPHDESKPAITFFVDIFFRNSSNMVRWLLLARLVMLFCMVNTENSSGIYYDGLLWITAKHRILSKYKQHWPYRTRCHKILIPPYIVCIRYGAALTLGACSVKPVFVSHSLRSLLIRMLMLWVNICSSDLQ